jgi:hypothetical protein
MIAILIITIHSAIMNTKSVRFAVLILLGTRIKEPPEPRDARAAEDAKDFALVVVKFG